MTVTVVGQRGDGPVMVRTVTAREFVKAWGRWAVFLWYNGQHGNSVIVDGCKVAIKVNVKGH